MRSFPRASPTTCLGSVCDIATATEFHQAPGRPGDQLDLRRIGVQRGSFRVQPSRVLRSCRRTHFERTFNVYFPGCCQPVAQSRANAISNPEYAYDPQGRLSPFYSLADNFTKVKGAHTIKMGFLISSASTHRFNDFAGGSGVNGGVIPVVALGVNANNSDGLSNCAGFPACPPAPRAAASARARRTFMRPWSAW